MHFALSAIQSISEVTAIGPETHGSSSGSLRDYRSVDAFTPVLGRIVIENSSTIGVSNADVAPLPIRYGELSLNSATAQVEPNRLYDLVNACWPVPASPAVAGADRILRDVISSLSEAPVEDGMVHPAETLIAAGLSQTPPSIDIGTRLAELFTDARHRRPSLAAGLLRIVGRQPIDAVAPWGTHLASIALQDPDIEIRDAAVRAMEAWGDRRAVGLLQSRSECEPDPWLRACMLGVVKDLSA